MLEYILILSVVNTLLIAILLMHCAFIPNILAVLLGVSDRLPSVDVVIFVTFAITIIAFTILTKPWLCGPWAV